MALTIKAASHSPRDGEKFAVTMIAFEVLIARLTRSSIRIDRDFFIEEIDRVGASNLKWIDVRADIRKNVMIYLFVCQDRWDRWVASQWFAIIFNLLNSGAPFRCSSSSCSCSSWLRSCLAFTGFTAGMVVGLAALGNCLGWKGFSKLEDCCLVIVITNNHLALPPH